MLLEQTNLKFVSEHQSIGVGEDRGIEASCRQRRLSQHWPRFCVPSAWWGDCRPEQGYWPVQAGKPCLNNQLLITCLHQFNSFIFRSWARFLNSANICKRISTKWSRTWEKSLAHAVHELMPYFCGLYYGYYLLFICDFPMQARIFALPFCSNLRSSESLLCYLWNKCVLNYFRIHFYVLKFAYWNSLSRNGFRRMRV